MGSANIENDPFFVLLTDALRAGPGSPQWHDAVAAVRQGGAGTSDEHRLLIEARENLESGREYRSVRAGAGFTRKLMGEIENEPANSAARPAIPTATLVAIVCGLLIVAVVAYVGYRLAPHEVVGQQTIEDLQIRSQRFFDSVASASFTGAIPPGWKTIGSLPLDAAKGLRPSASLAGASKNLGGGIRWSASLPANQAFAVDVQVNAPTPTEAVLLEAFVSTDPDFSAEKGTSSRDLVWQLRGREQQVLLSGSGQRLSATPAFAHGDTVRLIVDKDVAIIEVVSAADKKPQRLWAGPHELGAGPRYVGVRFLQTGAAGKEDLSVQQIKITTGAQ